MADGHGQHAQGGDRFAWIDPGVSVWDQWGAVPPPPKVRPSTTTDEAAPPETRPAVAPSYPGDPEPLPEPAATKPREPVGPEVGSTAGAPTFHEFDAELDVAELDERLRPVTTWSARSTSVNRSSLGFRSRRMCYPKTLLMIAVHLIDDKPTFLAGRVTACEYDGEGLYSVEVELMPKPVSEELRKWEAQR
jgi:hypothetical protein